MFEDNDGRTYEVVRNDQDQYSVWPAGRALPTGWERAGGSGGKADCLALIDGLWGDLRPKTVRERSVAR